MEPTLISKRLITSTLHQLASINHDPSTSLTQPPTTSSASRLPPKNPLTSLPKDAAERAKSALLTLHFLFPFDFLPALDLIDRQLIQKLYCQHPHIPEISTDTFYVQSASAVASSNSRVGRGSRFGNRNYAATRVHYEVRLDAWNCSCPAFAAASLKLILGDLRSEHIEPRDTSVGMRPRSGETDDNSVCERDSGSSSTVLIGGVATKDDALVPVCKHILAAVLCDTVPHLFGADMKSREVSMDELAAWAAGWGET